MVVEGQWCQMGHQRFHVVGYLTGRGDACEQQHMVVAELGQRCSLRSLREDRFQFIIVDRREEQPLVGIQVHGLGDDTVLHGLQVFRTFGDDDDVGTVLSRQWLAQSAGRQQHVVDNQTVVVDQQDVDAGLDITVLEGVVQEYDIDILVILHQRIDAMTAVLVDSHDDIAELLLHLVRFVANLWHRGLCRSLYETSALTLVAATEHGGVEGVFQQADEILHMGCLATAPNGDVAYCNDRDVESTTLQHTDVEERVPEIGNDAIEPAQRQQPSVDFDEVAFHCWFLFFRGLDISVFRNFEVTE